MYVYLYIYLVFNWDFNLRVYVKCFFIGEL